MSPQKVYRVVLESKVQGNASDAAHQTFSLAPLGPDFPQDGPMICEVEHFWCRMKDGLDKPFPAYVRCNIGQPCSISVTKDGLGKNDTLCIVNPSILKARGAHGGSLDERYAWKAGPQARTVLPSPFGKTFTISLTNIHGKLLTDIGVGGTMYHGADADDSSIGWTLVMNLTPLTPGVTQHWNPAGGPTFIPSMGY